MTAMDDYFTLIDSSDGEFEAMKISPAATKEDYFCLPETSDGEYASMKLVPATAKDDHAIDETCRDGKTTVMKSEIEAELYLHRGRTASGNTNELWKYNIKANTWEQLTSGGNALIKYPTVELTGKLYSISYNGLGVDRYNISGDSWTALTTSSKAISRSSAVAFEGRIYLHGGVNSTNDMWVYDIDANSWSAATPSAWDKRTDNDMPINDGKAYVFMGLASGTFADDMWEYDIATDTWTELTSLGVWRQRFSAAALDGKIYVYGGWVPGVGKTSAMSAYDIATDTWTALTSGTVSMRRDEHASAAFNGKVYIHGGLDIYGNKLSDLLVYDVATDAWTQLTTDGSWPSARYGARLITVTS